MTTRSCFTRFVLAVQGSALIRLALAMGVLIACALVVDPAAWLAAPFVLGASLTEGQHTGEFILAECPGTISRDTVTVTVAANTTLEPGTVLGQITSSGKYEPYDDGYSDGREVAAGILYGEARNDTEAEADVEAVIVDFAAEVRAADLVWGTGVDETGGTADLAALGIKAR